MLQFASNSNTLRKEIDFESPFYSPRYFVTRTYHNSTFPLLEERDIALLVSGTLNPLATMVDKGRLKEN